MDKKNHKYHLSHSKFINKMFVYNHKKSEWREVAGMKTARAMFGAVLHKGKIIVTGGANEEGLLASSEIYDFGTNKYVRFCPMCSVIICCCVYSWN